MLRIERGPGSLTVVSRFSRRRPLAVLAIALAALAALAARASPVAAGALVAAAVLVVLVGGRAVRAVFAAGRVRVTAPVPLRPPAERSLAAFSAARVETLAEARRRAAERRAQSYRARAGSDLPSWLRPADQPGANDHLRRVVLEGAGGEPLAVTAWLADDDLEGVRREVEALVRGG